MPYAMTSTDFTNEGSPSYNDLTKDVLKDQYDDLETLFDAVNKLRTGTQPEVYSTGDWRMVVEGTTKRLEWYNGATWVGKFAIEELAVDSISIADLSAAGVDLVTEQAAVGLRLLLR